ncbi:hypothetical protein LCGC14_1584890 [marine sediment metagenome]|uniref:Uncharacterized protein n=1 Tax=marine sediment metagenome TaxID=412755 RepID=A0A0F9IFR3_9ZZZZ
MGIFAFVIFTAVVYLFTKRDFKEARVRASRRAWAHRHNPNWKR